MPEKQIKILNPNLPTSGNAAPSHEQLPQTPRLVVLGSRISGAVDLKANLSAYFKEQGHEVGVNVERFAAGIDDAFYGRLPLGIKPAQQEVEGLALEGKTDEKSHSRVGELVRKASSLLMRKSTQEPASGKSQRLVAPESIPQGVIAFTQMRQYDPVSASTMFIDTPIEHIQTLCEAHGVPLAIVDRIDGQQQLAEAANQLLPGQQQ